MRRRPLALTLMAMACGLIACKRAPSGPLGVVVLRDGAPVSASPARSAEAMAPKDVTCQLQTQSAARGPACGFIVGGGQTVFGPYTPLPPGEYAVDFDLGTDRACPGGAATIDVVTAANNFTPLASRTVTVKAATSERLEIVVDDALGDTAPLEFRTALHGAANQCVVLKRVVVHRP
jgi:hypothetical protein